MLPPAPAGISTDVLGLETQAAVMLIDASIDRTSRKPVERRVVFIDDISLK